MNLADLLIILARKALFCNRRGDWASTMTHSKHSSSAQDPGKVEQVQIAVNCISLFGCFRGVVFLPAKLQDLVASTAYEAYWLV